MEGINVSNSTYRIRTIGIYWYSVSAVAYIYDLCISDGVLTLYVCFFMPSCFFLRMAHILPKHVGELIKIN